MLKRPDAEEMLRLLKRFVACKADDSKRLRKLQHDSRKALGLLEFDAAATPKRASKK
jgi:hypothetical protein